MISRLNTMPFILWWTRSVDVEKTDHGYTIDGQAVHAKPVPKWVIFTIKHFPLLWFALWIVSTGFFAPGFNSATFAAGLVMVTAIAVLFIKGQRYMQWIFIALFTIAGYWLIFNGYHQFVHQTLGHAIRVALLALVLVDMWFLHKRDRYYFIEDMEQELTGSGSRLVGVKRRWGFVPVGGRYKRQQLFHFRLPGFFLKTQDEHIGGTNAA